MTEVVELAAGELEAAVVGGALLSVVSLRHRGTELLAAPGAVPAGYRVHGERAGITFLHPWANRVGADRFAAAGREVDVAGAPVGRDGRGLAIHGLAVPGTWAPEHADDQSVTVRAHFAATPAFPWEHDVAIGIDLATPASLVVTTTVLAAEPVPIAFGWHPYFTLPGAPRADWRLGLPARTRLRLDERGIPDGATTAEEAEDDLLGNRTFDDGYEVGDDIVRLAVRDGERTITVVHDEGYPVAQVFAPGDADVVSLEPMTAPTDALRSGRGLRLADTFTATYTVTVTEP